MNTIHIEICIDNDAFQDRLSEELQDILNAPSIINRLCETASNSERVPLRDTNGNTVGHAWVSLEDHRI